MPTYTYRCSAEHLSEQWLSIHADDSERLRRCTTCSGPVTLSIEAVNTYAVGSRGSQTASVDGTERVWARDMDAYKRFRGEGVQPRRIDGCDRLESTALGTWHVETGQPHKDEVISGRTEEAKAIMRGQA